MPMAAAPKLPATIAAVTLVMYFTAKDLRKKTHDTVSTLYRWILSRLKNRSA
jgi:hypothetical protein